MVFSLFEYLDQVNCNHRYSMFNLGKFFIKNAITFNLTKIERKKKYFITMKFCCASNGALKNLIIARKKLTFLQFFFNKIVIFPKITDFLKT